MVVVEGDLQEEIEQASIVVWDISWMKNVNVEK